MFALNYNFVNVVINNKLPTNETNDVNKPRRLILGLFILILVDILWIASSQLTKYIYAHEQFEKPFFSTYVKTSMFSLYLLGLCCWPPARDASPQNTPENYTLVDENTEDENFFVEANNSLSDSTFVPVRASGDTPDLSGTEGDDHLSNRAVRFNRVAEVRHMSAAMATEALVARLSWAASERAGRAARSRAARRRAARLAKLALGFCILWFCAEYTYAASLVWVEAGVVALLWSGWAVFALALAALFPVGAHDRCSPSKLLAAALSLVGLVAVSLCVERRAGALLALLSGFCYAAYLLLLRRHLLHDDRLHIPLLFGLIGVFSSVLVWPVGGALHATAVETFEWPSRRQWALLLLNGLLATLLAELMWLWGCVISASWQAGAACLCAAAPLALAVDAALRAPPPAVLAAGAAPLALAGAAAILLAHRAPAADPVRAAVGSLCGAVRRGRGSGGLHRLTELDDQTEALISINCARDEQIA